MPKCKLVDARSCVNRRNVNFQISIEEALLITGMSKKDLAKRSGIPQSTIYHDLKFPESMTIGRARKYFDSLDVPSERRGTCL